MAKVYRERIFRTEPGSITALNAVGIIFICAITIATVGYVQHENTRARLQNTVDLYAISVAQLVQNGSVNTEACAQAKVIFQDMFAENTAIQCMIPAENSQVQISRPSPLPFVGLITVQAEAGPRA